MFPCLVVIRLTRSIDLKLLLVHHNKTLFPACFSPWLGMGKLVCGQSRYVKDSMSFKHNGKNQDIFTSLVN